MYTNEPIHKTAHLCAELLATQDIEANSFIKKGLIIKKILQDLNAHDDMLIAGLLYPSFQQINKNLNESLINLIESKTNPYVLKLLLGTQKMSIIDSIANHSENKNIQKQLLNNARQMLLAIVDDIRIVVIRLAERLMHLQSLRYTPIEQQKSHAKIAINIYAPLANQLGIGQLKWQLEDLAFRYLDPDNYQKISKSLNKRRIEREHYITTFINAVQALFKSEGIKQYKISGRVKHIYSIYRKIKRKDVTFDAIYDASAIRILLPSVEDCYRILGVVHNQWDHIPSEFDDYIAKPKPNGYRSIHTAVIGPDNHPVEIQIRTEAMHSNAELGCAAHWKYKEGGSSKNNYNEKIDVLRHLLDWEKELTKTTSSTHEIMPNLFKDHIYIFTPEGDVFSLTNGATPLDFAYALHTDIGHRCRGAIINEKISPLTQALKTGDRVKILTGKEKKPSRDWINSQQGYLKTSRAQQKVRHFFRQQEKNRNFELGLATWEKATRSLGLSKQDIKSLLKPFNSQTTEDFLIQLGHGNIPIQKVLNYLSQSQHQSAHLGTAIKMVPLTEKKLITDKISDSTSLTVSGVSNLLTPFARCCDPKKENPIIGFITKTRGITIHRKDCYNIKHILNTQPERLIEVNWEYTAENAHLFHLYITAYTQPHLIKAITSMLTHQKLQITGIHQKLNKEKGLSEIHLTIDITETEPSLVLKQLTKHLKSLPDIIDVRSL